MSADASLGVAILELDARMDKLEEQLEKGRKTTENKVDGMIKAFNAILSSAILAAIVKAYKEVVAAGEEALVAEAKVAAVIRATGSAAGYTVPQLSKMADEFSRLSGVDDEVILNAEAVLLTFRNIGRDVFPEATQAALDMSAVMGQDLQSSIVQIGKALNDPIAGISALSRVGVTFSEDQKKMIQSFMEVNDLAGAQGIILGELQSEFGGTAAQMESVTAGGNRLKISWGNLQEELGKNMVPKQRMWNLLLADTLDLVTENVASNNRYTDAQRAVVTEMNRSGEAVIYSRAQYNMHRDAIEENVNAFLRWTQYGAAWEERLAAEATGAENLGTALQTIDFKSLLDLTVSLSSETSKFNEQQEGVRAKQAAIKTEIDNLLLNGWSPLSQKVIDLQTDYDNLGLQYDENAVKHQAAMDKILFDLFMQKISVDGVTDAEYAMALKIGENTGIIDEASAAQALAFDAVTTAVLEGKTAIEETQSILDLMSHGYTIDVAINIANRDSLEAIKDAGVSGNGKTNYGGKKAKGGDVFSNQFYLVGENGPEIFAPGMDGSIIPNISISKSPMAAPAIAGGGGMSLSAGGGAAVINFYNQPFISTQDEYEAEAKLRGIVERINRRGANQ